MEPKLIMFNQLKADKKIPETAVIEDYTESLMIKLLSENKSASGEPERLTVEQYQELAEKAAAKMLGDYGIDKTDAKYLKLPDYEQALNDGERELLKDVNKLTDAQKRALANKQIRHLLSPFLKTQQGKPTGHSVPLVDADQQLALVNEGTTTQGGYLVPVEFIAEVSRLLVNYGGMPSKFMQLKATSKTGNKPKVDGMPTGAYVAEQAAKPESNPTFGQIGYTRHDYAFISGVTKQLLQDSGVDIVGLLAEFAANDFGKNRDNQIINGTSLTSYLNADSAIVPITTASANPDSVTNKNLTDMMLGTPFGANGEWYMHRTEFSYFLNMKDSNNRPLYSLSDQLASMASMVFMGRPVNLIEVMQPASGLDYLGNVNAPIAGDIMAFYGDMKKAGTWVERTGLDILVSDIATVGGNSAYEKNLVFWRFEEAHDFMMEQGKAITKLVLGT